MWAHRTRVAFRNPLTCNAEGEISDLNFKEGLALAERNVSTQASRDVNMAGALNAVVPSSAAAAEIMPRQSASHAARRRCLSAQAHASGCRSQQVGVK